MLDLIIKGGQVVTTHGVEQLEIGVKDGEVVVLAHPGVITAQACLTIDAVGMIVTPGGIEPHAHILFPVPRRWTGQGGVLTQSPEAATRAAAFGGTTTVVDFAYP